MFHFVVVHLQVQGLTERPTEDTSDERTPRRTLISVIYAVTVYVSVTSSLPVGLINRVVQVKLRQVRLLL